MEKIKYRDLNELENFIIKKWINKNFRIQEIHGSIILRNNWEFIKINLCRAC
jgi:hypothetical protein